MKIKAIGQFISLPGGILAPLSSVGSLIVLVVSGYWQQALFGIVIVILVATVILPLLFNLGNVVAYTIVGESYMHFSKRQLTQILVISTAWQSAILLAIVTAVHVIFLGDLQSLSFLALSCIYSLMCMPLFILAAKPSVSELAQEKSLTDAGMYSTGVALALLAELLSDNLVLGMCIIIFFLFIRIWFATTSTN